VLYQGGRIRQRLLALSDVERTQVYEFCGTPSLPLTDLQATLRVTPIIDGGRAFVEWSATFDCEPARREEMASTLSGWFAKWLESLRAYLVVLPAVDGAAVPDSNPEQGRFDREYRLRLRD
jgi:hypothetical protein